MATPDLVFLDSCVIIDYLINDPERNKYVEPILLDAEKGNIIIVVSVLAIAEVYHLSHVTDSKALETIDAFFNQGFVDVCHVDDRIARKSAEFRRETVKLKAFDAIHVSTAILRGARYLITRDGEDKKRNEDTMLALSPFLRDEICIMTPKEYSDLLSSELKQAELELATERDNYDAEEETE